MSPEVPRKSTSFCHLVVLLYVQYASVCFEEILSPTHTLPPYDQVWPSKSKGGPSPFVFSAEKREINLRQGSQTCLRMQAPLFSLLIWYSAFGTPAHGVEDGEASFNVVLEPVHSFGPDEPCHRSNALPDRKPVSGSTRTLVYVSSLNPDVVRCMACLMGSPACDRHAQ